MLQDRLESRRRLQDDVSNDPALLPQPRGLLLELPLGLALELPKEIRQKIAELPEVARMGEHDMEEEHFSTVFLCQGKGKRFGGLGSF